nr:reverse transcriptase [Tanacetum cinerariifolium]
MMFQTFAIWEFIRINGGEGTSNKGGGYGRLTRLDFLKFNRDDVNGWLFRVQQFFLIDNVQEDQKIGLVSMHLYDKALEWHKQFIKNHGENVLWPEGLKSEIGMPVKMFKPTTLKDASCLARMQEAALALPKAKPASQYGGYRSNSGTYSNRYVSFSTPVTKPVLALPSFTTKNAGKVVKIGFRKQLTQKELEEKRAKGLCFYCDQKYAPGNKCTGHLYSLEVSVDEEDQEEEVCIDIEVKDDTQVATYTKSFPRISLHALSGVSTFQTMRVRGYVGKQPLHILIDCESTHNFLDTSAAKRLSCQLSATTPLRVDVANGSKMGEAVRIFDDKLTLKQLLSTYEDVFAMPTEFPPPRSHDHTITLLPNTPPVTVTPYRLPPNQKDVVKQMSKSIFLAPKVEYLGHVLSAQGVATNPLKIQAMASWPIPKTLKQLRAEVAFNQLKQGMMSSPVLALPNFEKEFIMETDASGSGIGVVLHQEGHHIAYLSKALSPRHQALSTYDKEFLAGKLVVGDVLELKDYLFDYVHATSIRGHSGVQVTLQNLKVVVYWKGMKKWVKTKLRIVIDRDKVFLSNFWKSLFKVLKVNLHVSTAYHPQSDVQTEVVNRCLECYLRCMIRDKPKEWMQWLSLAEYWYNTNFHSSTNITLFEAVYGQPLPTYVPYESGESHVESVDRSLQAREQTIQQLKFHLQRSQDRMRNLANKHRTDRQFKVGIQIHNVFHVSQLKKCTPPVEASGVMPAVDSEGLLLKTPAAILDRRLGKVRNSPVMYVLVQWTDESVEDVT